MKTKNKELKSKIKNNSLELQEPIYTCFHCQKSFKVNYNRGIGMPSQKNFWLYWVDDKWDYKQMRRKPDNERGGKICDESLKKIWLGREWEYLDLIENKSRCQTLANYIYHGII
ncbi:MAG: hypothetical protein I3273_06755 [Candidatus Moeniiplasma glomeromycotorum]|nr:hypothetical protein [Candidatus Moeniiplasma glomeromycotorum]MCE8169785.1 hypothetical protein [Candidatus Moeniiplasma glomeromycotorum]